MLLLSTHPGPGERPVSVRVDDLPEQERALVRETLRIIKAMSDREDAVYALIAIVGTLGFIGMIPIMFHYVPKSSFMQFTAGVMGGAAMVVFLGWLITRSIVDHRHDTDALLLTNLSRHARCSVLIHEYRETNPWFARVTKRHFEQTVTAQ